MPRHIQKRDLRHRHNPKNGGLGTGTTPKTGVSGTAQKGDLRHGHEYKGGGGGLKNWSCKKDNISN